MILLLILLLVALTLLLDATIFWLVGRLFRAPKASFTQALKVAAVFLASFLAATIIGFIIVKSPGLGVTLSLVALVGSVIVCARLFQVHALSAVGMFLVFGVISVFASSVLNVPFRDYAVAAFNVRGTSMSPTLTTGDYLLTSKLDKTFGGSSYEPKRGQIIIYQFPKDTSKVFVSRVIALPGERVVVKSGKITVFNQSQPAGFNPDSAYGLAGTDTLIDTDTTVPSGSVFVVGDNRAPLGAFDSREWGPLPTSDIISTAAYRVAPSFKSL